MYNELMAETAFEHSAKLLVLLHAVGAMALVGSCTHHGVITLRVARAGLNGPLDRLYSQVTAVSYAVTFVLGALAYPTYRFHVRAQYLDEHAPWAVALFEVKENVASVGLALCIGAFVTSRLTDPAQAQPAVRGHRALVLGTTAAVWFEVISGLLITLVRGV